MGGNLVFNQQIWLDYGSSFFSLNVKKVDSKTQASHLSNAPLHVSLLWITRSRKSVELDKERNIIKCEKGQITQCGV